MTRPRFRFRRALDLFRLMLVGAASAGAGRAATNELGRPVLHHYPPGDHLRGLTSPRVTQDPTGIVYFANNGDLLSFDGAVWDYQRLSPESAGVRQFALTPDGTLFMAGAGVLGYLRGTGKAAGFVSLADQLPPSARNIDELHCAVALGAAVYFSDEEKILIWRDGKFTVLPFPTGESADAARLHRVGDTLYVTAPARGLCRVVNDAVETVSTAAAVRDNVIVSIEAGAGGALVLLTAERGFFQRDADGRIAPLPLEANRWLAGKRIFCALRLEDGSRVVGFSAVSGDGGMRFGPAGRYVGPLDTSIGLLVTTLRGFCRDREGGLWIGTEANAARLEWPSPASLFDGVNGLGQGAVADVVRHDGVLYAETSEGFFRLVPAAADGRAAHFERIAESARPPEFRAGAAPRPAPRAIPLERVAGAVPHFLRATLGPISGVREETDADRTVWWLCGAHGLGRLEAGAPLPAPVPFAAQLRALNVRAGERLPTRAPAVTFDYVAPRQRPTSPVSYQTRLSGLEDEWSEWSARRSRSFANLPPGDYRFEVRARDAEGIEAAPAALEFGVAPPWWRTRWALLGDLLAGVGFVAAVVRFRTRALRARAAALERVVAERTLELAAKNRELTRLHQMELDEKTAARLAEEKARLEMLRYQLNPHFLFNTLASISASLPADARPAHAMLDRLADFCRLTLHRADEGEHTTLGDEMRLLRTYLEIERSRWGDLLAVEIDCATALEAEALPYFLLLPLVENALKYGRATSPDRVALRVTARRDPTSGDVVIEVANTGEWVESSAVKNVSTLGIGLDNLRERLARHYPRTHDLKVSSGGGWVRVELRLRSVGVAAGERVH